MRKGTAFIAVVMLAGAGLLVSSLQGQNRPQPVRGRPAPLPEMSETSPGAPTRIQLEVFQLDGVGAKLAALDLDQVATGSPSEVLARLGEFGQARLLHRLDTSLNLQGRETSIRVGNRVPVVQDVARTQSGQVAPSVSYNDVGLSLQLGGSWVEDDDEQIWASLNCNLEWSSIAETPVKMSEEVKLPSFGQFKFNQPLEIRDGDTLALLASHQPLSVAPDSPSTLGIVRITLRRLSHEPPAAPAEKP